MPSICWLLGAWRETGVIAVPGDGPLSWTAREDAAEVAAVILTSGDPFDGPVTLTADAAPTFAHIAETATEVTGRAVRLELVEPDASLAAQVAASQSEPVARFLVDMYLAAQGGSFAGTDPLLARLRGRQPRTVRHELAG